RRLHPELVARGKALASRVKILGQQRDWKGILAALEQGPRNAIVCSVAVGALGKLGKWREALGVLQDMRGTDTGDDWPDAFVYSAAIDACGKAGKPVEAVRLLEEMPSKNLLPDEVCYGAAIAALAEGAA
ncbi:unnamed protein product, partial [Discosporangium mesarthrocarpum]